jgi:membrane protein DedA with SNARE-associated domain
LASALNYLGFFFGENWEILRIYFRKFDYLIFLLLILAAIGWWWRQYRKNQQKL